MVKLRLARSGAKRRPVYRVVAADSRCPRDGRYIEQCGFYDPNAAPAVIRFDTQRLERWLNVGAQPTDTVRRLISKWRVAQPEA
jgi:small subunit ribosomal protein S16